MSYDGNVIAHQVNCQRKMNKGLAKTIRYTFPDVYTEYMAYTAYNAEGKLGHMQPVHVGNNYYVCNLFGQLGYGEDTNYTKYEKLEECFVKLQDFAIKKGFSEVAMPFGIGCGLAGGDWNEVYRIMESVFKHVIVKLYKL